MNLAEFRKKTQMYLRLVGQSQKSLANILFIHPTMLSHKLNGSDAAHLSALEVKQIIKSLAQWEAIDNQAQAIELLEMMDLSAGSFKQQEWQSAPLKVLTPLPGQSNFTAQRLVAMSNSALVKAQATVASSTTVSNLPHYPTTLIGREREVATACSLLQRPDVRLLTFSGPGGTGKTRLSLQVAAKLVLHFADGVYFVALSAITDPRLALINLAQTLGLKENSQQDVIEVIKQYVQNKRLLLVLDNLEQVLGLVTHINDLLMAAPELKFLITSRNVLHSYGEYEFIVPTLGLPDLTQSQATSQILKYDAVRLFVERTQAVRPDFVLDDDNAPAVAEICRRLDGLPLALELAAARSKLFTPQAMLTRLGSRLKLLTGGAASMPARHQALRSTLDWSYNLMTAPEQRLFARLGVFVGGCTLDSAVAVCKEEMALNLDEEADKMLAQLTSLLDKSMLRFVPDHTGEPRFFMLETVREYALERLEASQEAFQLQKRHLDYFLQIGLRTEERLKSAIQLEWLEFLEAEHENLRAALENSQSLKGELETGLRLGAALSIFWHTRTYWQEATQLLTALLQQSRAQGLDTSLAYAAALSSSSLILLGQGYYKQAQVAGEEAINLLKRQPGNDPEVRRILGNTHQILGQIAYKTGAYIAARPHFEETYRLRSELNDISGAGNALNNIAILALFRGDYAQARKSYERNLETYRTLGNKLYIAISLANLGEVFYFEQDYPTALTLYHEALPLYKEIGSKEKQSLILHSIGLVEMAQGNYSQAPTLFEQALVIRRKLEAKQDMAETLIRLGDLACWQTNFVQATPYYREGLTIASEIGSTLDIIRALEGYVNLLCAALQFTQAVQLAAVAHTQRQLLNLPLPLVESRLYVQAMEQARNGLATTTFEVAWQTGTALTLEQAVEMAFKAWSASVMRLGM